MPRALPLLLSLCLACAADEKQEHDSPVEGLVLGTIQVDPPIGIGSRTLVVTVRLPAATTAELQIGYPGAGEVPMPAPSLEDGWLVSRVTMPALANTGDQVIVARGQSDAGRVFAAGIYHATAQHPCPSGQILQGGECYERRAGHVLHLASVATIAEAHGEGDDISKMQHPRASYRIGNARVGCHTNHIGIFSIDDLETMEELLWTGAEPPAGLEDEDEDEEDDGTTPVVQTFLSDHGLAACEHLVWDGADVVISSSRGTAAADGGIVSWRLPSLESAPFEPVEYIDSIAGPDGVEGIVLRDSILYAARKPNRIATFEVSADGKLEELADVVVPELISAWEVALVGDVLVVSDPSLREVGGVLTEGPDGFAHYNHPHQEAGGRVFTIDVSDPASPDPQGWAQTVGASKGLAALPDDVVAVANGSAGIELIDVSNSLDPRSRLVVQTPGTVNAVSYHDGLLAAADWDSIRLYDASESGGLRLLDAHDFGVLAQITEIGPATQPPEVESLIFQPVIALSDVRLDDSGFTAVDLDHVYAGRIERGAEGPRLLLHDARRPVRVGPDAPDSDTFGIRVSNGGRETLWVRPPDGEIVAVPPFGRELVEVTLTGLKDAAPNGIVLESNDPTVPIRFVQLLAIEDQYAVGDVAPEFSLPGINWCTDGACDRSVKCVSSTGSLVNGRPIFLSFFASW